jgi:predicted NACHT family NTPase
VGEPGSGKSTFVNFVALCLAGEALGDGDANLAVLTAPLPAKGRDEKPQPQPWDHDALLPVRVVLRDLAARGLPASVQRVSGDVLWGFIVSELGETLAEYAPYLKAELVERGGLILLDGLDEVPDAHQRREQVKQAVQDFAACFPRCRFLVTSRTYAYQRQDWKLAHFAEVVLSPFTPAQAVRFVDGWYAHVGALRGMDAQDAQGRATLLKAAIQRSERLAELAARLPRRVRVRGNRLTTWPPCAASWPRRGRTCA